MKWFNDMRTIVKLIVAGGIVMALLVATSIVAFLNMKGINDDMTTLYYDHTLPIQELGAIIKDLYNLRGNQYRYIMVEAERAPVNEEIASLVKDINQQLDLYKSTQLVKEETDIITEFEKAWAEYQEAVKEELAFVDAGNVQAAIQSQVSGRVHAARPAATKPIEELISLNVRIAEELSKQGDQSYANASRIILVISIVFFIIAVVLSILLITSINQPIKIMAGALSNLARGDLNRSIPQEVKDSITKRKDEFGEAGKGLEATEKFLIEMAAHAERIASGNLTVNITPKSENDEIGHAFHKMVNGLQESVRQVADNTSTLNLASSQLSDAANQAAQATTQISTTIQQIASGTTQQTDSVSKTAGAIDQLTRAIDGVAKGAQDQSNAINQTSLAMQKLSSTVKNIQSGAQDQVHAIAENQAALIQFSQSVEKLNQGAESQAQGLGQAAEAGGNLTDAIQQVATAAVEVSAQVQEAAEAAQRGTSIVNQTAEGMQKVREATDTLANRVQGLGQRSGEIGVIVSTIDDIASQTNLLALNAAIEAARAGEHGKGFAVVADEVRKLAEKSALATKEIGELVRTVQEGAGEAVTAMQQAGEDVSAASEYTRQTSVVFEAIVKGTVTSAGGFSAIQQAIEDMEAARRSLERTIEDARRIADENKDQSVQMEELNKTIVTRLEGVQRVAESNVDAAREMTKLNEAVIEQLDNASAIVEENTAATEEMSASAGQVSVMVENIASVSEQNSAATEEVSASTEEMSAQVEEVTASATSLAEMAQNLEKVVRKFQL